MSSFQGTVDAVNLCYWMLEQAKGEYENLDELLRQEVTNRSIAEVLDMDPCE